MGGISVEAEEANLIPLTGTPFQIELPAGFGKSSKVSGTSVVAFYQPADAKGIFPGFTATLEDHHGTSLDEVCDHVLGILPGAEVHSRKTEMIAGKSALVIDVSNASILGKIRAVRLLVAHQGKVLVLGFADRDAGFTGEALAAYLKALKSLKAG